MNINYSNDNSYFITVFPPFVYYGWSVKSWLLNNDWAKYRYIRDFEIEQEFWNIGQINTVYEDIKTIAIVVNPWDRIYYAYQQLYAMKEANDNRLIDLSNIPLDNFSDFVSSLPSMPDNIGNFWFSITTPISKWIDYEVGGKIKTVDYILKDTTFEKDFEKIQEYFCSDMPLVIPEKLPNYKQFYNKKTKDIIANLFKEDIDRFGYEF